MKLKLKTIAALSLISLSLLAVGCGDNNAIELPTQEQLSDVGLDGVKQTDELDGSFVLDNENTKSESYVLADYELEDKTVSYTYVSTENINNSLTCTAKKMTPEEYEDFVPDINTTEAAINDYSCTFVSRTVHYVPDDYVPSERVKENVEKGTTEIKYGSGTEQLLPIQKMYWYDSENQIGYCLEIMGQYYTLEDWSTFAQSYMEDAQ